MQTQRLVEDGADEDEIAVVVVRGLVLAQDALDLLAQRLHELWVVDQIPEGPRERLGLRESANRRARIDRTVVSRPACNRQRECESTDAR